MAKKHTLITGAGSGIGKATAKFYARKKHNLILVDVNKENLERTGNELQAENNADMLLLECDLSDETKVFELYEKTRKYDISIWINNAGLGNIQPILEQDIHRVLLMNSVNVTAVTILTTLYAQDYRDKEATLINVSSINGYSITQGNPLYSAGKFYVSALSEALYWELKTKNKPMRIKIVAPAATKTAFLGASKNQDPKDEIDFKAIYGNYNTPEQIAEFINDIYESDQLIGYADGNDYTFHLVGPKLPHSLNKQETPSLLLQ